MKRKPFRQLTDFDRDRIKALLVRGHTKAEIARVLAVPRSKMSREIGRLGMDESTYDPLRARGDARNKRRFSKYQGMKVETLPEVKRRIIEDLEKKRSPDEIAGRLRLESGHTVIGKDAIYRWLYSAWGQQYCQYLCTKRRKKRRPKNRTKREMIPNRIPICERPQRGTHWQGDLFVSPQKLGTTESVATVVEERSKYIAASKMANRKPSCMKAVIQRFSDCLHMDTLTLDNGTENREHHGFGVQGYFCDPHSPWQKGSVENVNKMIRRYIPKGANLKNVSQEYLNIIAGIINNKPRAILGFKSAYEVARLGGVIKNGCPF